MLGPNCVSPILVSAAGYQHHRWPAPRRHVRVGRCGHNEFDTCAQTRHLRLSAASDQSRSNWAPRDHGEQVTHPAGSSSCRSVILPNAVRSSSSLIAPRYSWHDRVVPRLRPPRLFIEAFAGPRIRLLTLVMAVGATGG